MLCCLTGGLPGGENSLGTDKQMEIGIWSRAWAPIPRFVDDLHEAQTRRLSSIPSILLPTSRNTRSTEVEQLHIDLRPIHKIGCRCRLWTGSVIC